MTTKEPANCGEVLNEIVQLKKSLEPVILEAARAEKERADARRLKLKRSAFAARHAPRGGRRKTRRKTRRRRKRKTRRKSRSRRRRRRRKTQRRGGWGAWVAPHSPMRWGPWTPPHRGVYPLRPLRPLRPLGAQFIR